MDVLNKFYSSMTSKVSQFSGVVLGNPVTREFEATEFIATAGPGLLWKVYKGYKKSTKQEVSIFIFEKKLLDHISKPDSELILETLKRGVTQLTKLRHPNILTVQYGLEESRDSLAFATEPIFYSLANVLGEMGNHTNMPNKLLKDFILHDLEIKYGLLNIVEGLIFLHNDVKLLHRNICPHSIIINKKRAWKIFGFEMCVMNVSPIGQPACWPFKEYSPDLHPLTQPMLDYLAPEYYLSARHCCSSDMYSLGMLIYVIYNPDHQPLGKIGKSYNKYKTFVNEIKNKIPQGALKCIPEDLQNSVKLMLNPIPELRPDLHQFSQVTYFDDFGIKTLKYIDNLVQLDNMQKSNFYKSLPQIMPKLPHRITVERILPALLNEFSNAPMLPFVLSSTLIIAESCSNSEYVELILPTLKKAMLILDPVQVQIIIMNKIELLLEKTPDADIKTDLLPMIYRVLDIEMGHLQELSLSALPNIVRLIDYTTMKNSVLPRLRKVCMMTMDISVKVKALLCISKLVEHMDKWLVLDEVVPFLVQIPMKEQAVVMANIGIFAKIMNCSKLGITKEITIQTVLPFLLPVCLNSSLTVNQFNTLMTLIKQMINKVESEHRVTLEQLNSMKNDAGNAEPIKPVEAPKSKVEAEKSVNPIGGVDLFAKPPPLPLNPLSSKVSNKSYKSETFLSLEDKVRLAQQQEQRRAMSRSSHDPVQSAVHANLSQLSSAANINYGTSTFSSSNAVSHFPTSPVSHFSPNIRSPTDSPPNRTQSHSQTSLNKSIARTYSTHTRPHTAVSHSYSKITMMTPSSFSMATSGSLRYETINNNNLMNVNATNRSQPDKQDWSAFESLLPQKKDNNENRPTTLSEQEIMDLLS